MALPAVLMAVGSATGFGDMDDLLEYSDVFAIALLVNGAVSLGLWLFGCWPDVAREGGVRKLAATAARSFTLATLSRGLLFATRATEYGATPLLAGKLALVGRRLIILAGS
ncbi:MAG: hypothetical protein QF510_06415 [Rhodospirillales bacterium]|nr:hypothetical protein [Rhodospirillales bacterium]